MPYHWEASSGGEVPHRTVKAGFSQDGESLFLGRAWHEGDLLPGKIHASHGVCYVAYGGGEHGHDEYEAFVMHGDCIKWTKAKKGKFPDVGLPIEAGHTADGETLYVGRCWRNEELVPGKIHPSHKCCYIPQCGEEVRKKRYEALVSVLKWQPDNDGGLPDNAVEAGQTSDGEPLFIARADHEGDLIPGKLHLSHGVCYVPWGGGEHGHSNYEVLVVDDTDRLDWVSTSGGAEDLGGELLRAGETVDGETLYVGRAWHEGDLLPGKVHRSHGCLYLAWGGEEIRKDEYEALIWTDRDDYHETSSSSSSSDEE